MYRKVKILITINKREKEMTAIMDYDEELLININKITKSWKKCIEMLYSRMEKRT